jgi:SAM-dependent methyltransferase
MTLTEDELKACCATAYASPAARWLLGESFHPGGARLTARLIRALAVGPGSAVVDVASGLGTSAIQLARETGCDVVGVDLSPESVAAATRAAEEARLAGRVRFLCGDAEALPLPDAAADGVLCECALCTFPDRAAAAAELARILRPGARLALSDVTADPGALPPELGTVTAWIACLGGARPLGQIGEELARAGLIVEVVERHDQALADLLDRVEARLRAACLLGDGIPRELRSGIGRGLELLAAARQALDEGALGYGVVVARRPLRASRP